MRDKTSGGTTITWSGGAVAGIIAGIVFLALEMVMVPVFLGGSPWGPPRMMGAIALGPEVLPPPASFDAGIVAVAVAVHLILSAVYGVLLAILVSRSGTGGAAIIGLVFGLLLYAVNFYGFTAVFPWFANARNWVTIFTHAVFGLAAAVLYKNMERRPAVPTGEGLGQD